MPEKQPNQTLEEYYQTIKQTIICQTIKDKQKLMDNLAQLRHTEFQVQTLLTRYNKMKTEPRSDIKKIIELLLPSVLVQENGQQKIHSLFEACKPCKQVNWLQIKKTYFMCYVLDNQIQKPQTTNTDKIILTPPLNQDDVEMRYTYKQP